MTGNITANPPTEETAEELRKLSQCLYNIKTIISVHSAETLGYEKELEHLYRMEIKRLPPILRSQTGTNEFSFDQALLTENLLENDYNEPEEIEKIKLAKKAILSLLTKVQREREKDPNYIASTGLEDGFLKNYIFGLINDGKKKYSKSLLGEKEDIGNNNDENKSKNIFKDSNNDYYLNEGVTPRYLKLGKKSLYYAALDTVYSLSPDGGTIAFREFTRIVPEIIKVKLRAQDDNEKCRVLRGYLTDRSNGFLRASKIGDATFKGKPLIECVPGVGIIFNNKK